MQCGSRVTSRWRETDSNRWSLAARPAFGRRAKKASSGSSTPSTRLGPQGDRGAVRCLRPPLSVARRRVCSCYGDWGGMWLRPQRGEISLANRGGIFLAAARLNSTRSHPAGDRRKRKEGRAASSPAHRYGLAMMIDQSFGYPAVQRWLRQIPQADFPRAPFAAGVVQGAMKLRIGIKFWLFSRCHTFTRFAVALSSSIRAQVGKTIAIVSYRRHRHRVVTPANFKAVPLPEISAWIALLCEGRATGSSLDQHFRKL